ncbi:putative RecB family nuclease [Aeromicrobium panaciterrae]|uniref:RecB family nuclease n=1 Tax=Aeromicrobium panaciterrae TaxID=363861 RepID=A0ABU1UNZ1_9ACTN|nr:TM0106 family RecB-like putative nuclease [Aeromicrobium panaciterrae]MDR7086855.1 putative RecB family nuclease [Aeromicrobium panaciterrae]
MRFDAGKDFEKVVFAEIRTELGEVRSVDLSDVRGKSAAIDATVSAIADDIELILGGWLPDDTEGGRTGRPDLLLRTAPGEYVPGDVKGHKVIGQRIKGELTYSTIHDPGIRLTSPGYAAETTTRIDDYLQLAHYRRMLEAIGRAGAQAHGFIIGSDQHPVLTRTGRVLTWVDLDTPLFTTYSRSQGTAKRSALERYDHEQTFRLKVARAAVDGAEPLVGPIFTTECDSCPWTDYCHELVGPDVASDQIRSGRLSVREWDALASGGVTSVEQLASLDTADPEFQGSYLPEVTHLRDALPRLDTAVRRARMLRDGVILERTTSGAIRVPRADIEIDFDIEWDPSDQVYLWGALVRRLDGVETYHPVVTWNAIDDAAAVELATQFATWLRGEIRSAEAAGQSLLVYHYSSPEPGYLKRILGEPAVTDLLSHFVDLLPIVRKNFFGLHGLGIKKVAPAFGFNWCDEDPGGLQSQLWLLDARGAKDDPTRLAAQQRILRYNEDDVRATAAIRNGI